MTENNNLLAEVNGVKIYKEDVLNLIANMQDGERFNNEEGIKVLADELINQQLLLIDAKNNKFDQDDEFLEKLEVVKNDMLKNYAMHKIFNEVNLSDDDIKAYYEEKKDMLNPNKLYEASHILIDSLEKANEIKEKLDKGEDFEDLAKKYSIDPSRDNGGSLGTFPKEAMVKEFQEGLDSIEIGEISEPVKSEFGYHIIKLIDIKQAPRADYEDVKENIKTRVLMIKRQEKYLETVENIKKDAVVKKYY